MNAKSIACFTLYVLATLLSLVSCINEPLAEGKCSTDGTRTPITLSIRGDRFPGGELPEGKFAAATLPTGRALSEEKETVISQLHLLVFNSNGEVMLNERFKDLIPTDGVYRLQTEMLPGNGMQFYVIANADIASLFAEDLPTLLHNITQLNELKLLIANLQANNYGLDRTDRLMMTGSITVDVTRPHRNAIPLTLNYLCAKVTVTFTDNTNDKLDIDITGWDMVSLPKRSYLLEQNEKDAVTGTKPEDYLTTDSKYPFESGSKQTKTWSQTCYLLENRRGGRVDKVDPTNPDDKYPDMDVDDNNQRGKAWYAPPGATYLLAYGTHTRDGQTNNIFYKIYLGENAVNDYNLVRGKHYQYNLTINGLNDINVDTNVEWGPTSFTVDTSDNLAMDAHADCRVLRIGGTAVDAQTPAYATVEVVSGSTWLTLSPLNLYRHPVKQTGNAGNHQQFGTTDGVGSFVRSRYTPTPTATAEFGNQMAFGMTRQLTRIPFAQPTVCTYQDVLVYADAHTGSGERTGQVRIIYYKGASGDEVAGQQTLVVTQNDAIQVSANLYAERYEESAMQLHPALARELQGTSVMQWGYSTAQLYSDDDRFSNGNYLTANAVYNTLEARNVMAAPQWTATTYDAYRPKYPRTGIALSEPSSITTSGTPYYYPELTQALPTTSYFHPIYNSSAARYCHEKNRDTNGDGIIDANETIWYLPSYADMVAIKKNPSATQPLIGTYWTSTEESTDKSWAFTFPAGTMEAVDKTTTNRVRCVRGAGITIPDATLESGESDKTQITLSASAGAVGIFRITDDKDFGLPWAVTSDVPNWLQIATDSKGSAAETSKAGIGDATFYAYASTVNVGSEKRTATLQLTRKATPATAVKAITVNQNYFLSIKGGSSNCYMVLPGSEVKIPVERANESFIELASSTYNSATKTYYQLLPDTHWTASLVWESNPGLVTISDNTGTGPQGSFTVGALTDLKEGNAIVAIKNAKNEILWSWHIWVTEYDGSTHFTTSNGKRNFVLMDRALGASSIKPDEIGTNGLIYQWGRKDPFPCIAQKGGSWSFANYSDPVQVYNSSGVPYIIKKAAVPSTADPNNLTNSIRNPDTYYINAIEPCDWFIYSNTAYQNEELWSGHPQSLTTPAPKSAFDPCPAGWRVPPWLDGECPFNSMMSGKTTSLYGCSWPGEGGYFPASGFRRFGEGTFYDPGGSSYWWTATANKPYCTYFAFGLSGAPGIFTANKRAIGFSLRCCQDNL